MTSKIKVNILADGGDNSIITSDGAGAVTFGTSGDSITIPSGVTITNNGTQTGFGGVNTPYFFGQKASGQSGIPRASFTKVTGFTSNEIDTNSAFDGTTFTVPSGEAGKYYIFAQLYCDYGTSAGSDGEYSIVRIYKNGSGVLSGLLEFPGTTNSNQHTLGASAIMDLSVSDYIEVYVFLKDENGNTADVASTSSVFGGYKLIGA